MKSLYGVMIVYCLVGFKLLPMEIPQEEENKTGSIVAKLILVPPKHRTLSSSGSPRTERVIRQKTTGDIPTKPSRTQLSPRSSEKFGLTKNDKPH